MYMSRVLNFYMAHLEMQMYEYQELTQTIDHFLADLVQLIMAISHQHWFHQMSYTD